MGSCFSVNLSLGPLVDRCLEIFDNIVADCLRSRVVERNVGHTVGMKPVLDEAWKKIMKKGVQTVGIYGIGGAGKTTLLNLINNKLKSITPGQFDVVIFVTVSKDYKKENVQEAILKFFGLKLDDWKNKTHGEKVGKIFEILKKKKFVLLLDDVWQRINLAEDIGVPKGRGNESKVVFTTRDQYVCGQMEADEDVKVKPLKWEKAWELFKTKIGEETLQSDHGRILSLAEDVAKECGGLPIAIITIAGAMARKRTYEDWRTALRNLRSSASKIKGMKEEVFGLLKFSYDELPNDMVHKPCFLYCCLFPEDWKIFKGVLIDYWIGEELCSSSDEGHEVIGNLVRASLLEEVEDQWVKMHDVVRDMALWLVDDCDEVEESFLVKAGQQLSQVPEVGSWSGKKRISLMRNNIERIEEDPMCPHLSTLLLCHNGYLKYISEGFFGQMSALKVLDLSYCSMMYLHPGICRLESLVYLNVSRSGMEMLPNEFKNLSKLKYLNLERNRLLYIPRQVISSFSLLNVLRMTGCGGLKGEESDIALVEELESLGNLNVLTVKIRLWSTLYRLSKNGRLSSCIQELQVSGACDLKSVDVVSTFAYMEKLEGLIMEGCTDFEDFRNYALIRNGWPPIGVGEERIFDNLRYVQICFCHWLSDLTWLALAPNLTWFEVSHCRRMTEIINSKKLSQPLSDVNLFGKLQQIQLAHLPWLKSICLNSLPFPNLEVIQVIYCPNLKKLPLNSSSAKGKKLEIKGSDVWWERLEWENEDAKAPFLHAFLYWTEGICVANGGG